MGRDSLWLKPSSISGWNRNTFNSSKCRLLKNPAQKAQCTLHISLIKHQFKKAGAMDQLNLWTSINLHHSINLACHELSRISSLVATNSTIRSTVWDNHLIKLTRLSTCLLERQEQLKLPITSLLIILSVMASKKDQWSILFPTSLPAITVNKKVQSTIVCIRWLCTVKYFPFKSRSKETENCLRKSSRLSRIDQLPWISDKDFTRKVSWQRKRRKGRLSKH